MRPRLTFANVVSVIALFVALGGTALATHPGGQDSISTGDIINGEVKVADIGQGAVATDEIGNGQVKTADIGGGEVRSGNVANDNLTGGDVATNSLKGIDIDEGTLDIGDTARAYARVNPFGCPGTPSTCTFGDSKGISSVSRPSTGHYCIHAPGIDPQQTPAAVTVDWFGTADPRGNTSAMAYAPGCGASAEMFRVITMRQPEITVDSGGGVNNATAAGTSELADNVAFTIVIP